MESKKQPPSDLKPLRGLFLGIGILVSISIVSTAFEYRLKPSYTDTEFNQEFWCDFDISPDYKFELDDTLYNEQDVLYLIVETEASFPNGKKAWHTFLRQNLILPSLQSSLEGKIFLSLIIEKDGKITQSEVIRGLLPNLDRAVLKALSSSPDWLPAKENGKPVKSRKILMIQFPLKGESH